jgi:copper(I)-binding protein
MWKIGLPVVFMISFLASGCATPAKGLQVQDAWARSAASGTTTGAFATIVNPTGETDRLVGAESDAAQMVEIHETRMVGDIMQMRPAEAIEIPAGGRVELKPGSYHLMLIELRRDLQPGEKLTITLIFEKAGRLEVEAEVKGL